MSHITVAADSSQTLRSTVHSRSDYTPVQQLQIQMIQNYNSCTTFKLSNGSHLVDHVRDALYKCHLSNTLCTHAAPYHRTPTSSVSGLCVHSGSSGQVRAKRLVVHPILTFFFFPLSLFWSHQTKECAPTLHNVEQARFCLFAMSRSHD